VQLAKVYDEIAVLNATLWAISPQTADVNFTLVERRGLPFPVLSDPDQAVIREWGLFNDDDSRGRLIPHPATFIIGTDGLVAWSHIGKSTRDRPTADVVLDQLSSLRK
jgi:peroxiredoxin